MDNKPVSILLVDDEKDFLEPIDLLLKSRGYDVKTLTNGRDAVDWVKENPCDIIFLDINMPVMDGIEALKEIRGFNKSLPVIMVTALYANAEKVSAAKGLGISGFFAKNYTLDQLMQMIQMTLRTHKGLHDASSDDKDTGA